MGISNMWEKIRETIKAVGRKETVEEQVKPKRGRPVGSKNKPKVKA